MKSIKPFIIPAIIWIYIGSAVLAVKYWTTIYDTLIRTLDLSPNGGWILPVVINLFFAALGIPQVIAFITTIKRRERMDVAKCVGNALCISGTALAFFTTIWSVTFAQNKLRAAAHEFLGGERRGVFEAGTIINNIYSNGIIGITMDLPPDWHVSSLNTIRRKNNSGAYSIAQNDEKQAEELAKERPGIYRLLALYKYPWNTKGYNPSLAITAEKKKVLATNGTTTLQAFALGFSSLKGPYHTLSGPSPFHIDNSEGYEVQVEGKFTDTVHQNLYLIQTDDYYLVLAASVIDDSDQAPMQSAIRSLKFLKTSSAR
ncbi:MAG TPA: hypothetical protein VH413_00105 [Verrucomicrobiae bacterium]|jgi:hypothetical protein|nr:hypothetical protein [Verrucomicrobiae bacterium]